MRTHSFEDCKINGSEFGERLCHYLLHLQFLILVHLILIGITKSKMYQKSVHNEKFCILLNPRSHIHIYTHKQVIYICVCLYIYVFMCLCACMCVWPYLTNSIQYGHCSTPCFPLVRILLGDCTIFVLKEFHHSNSFYCFLFTYRYGVCHCLL